jgi:Ca-activated chloride channel family protein
MNVRLVKFSLLALFFTLITLACGSGSSFTEAVVSRSVVIEIVYGSEKKAWMEPLVEQYNAEKHKTESGSFIEVVATPMGSIESVDAILAETIRPTVWSPASSVYVPVANAEWRKTHAEDLTDEKLNDLVRSPVVIAMWEPMARTLGWPDSPIGWADIADLSISEEGWAAYGYPEWGIFKFGHTHPDFSNSGIISVIAEAYAGLDKQRGLTLEDIQDEELRAFMESVESSVIHYGRSTGFFATRMFEKGPSYLSAAVMYENLVVEQETKRINGDSFQLPVVAIYPKEGTFWSNHPYAILNVPWINDEMKEAARLFEQFLLDRPQQVKAIELGFRPADISIDLGPPLDAEHGVDIQQPQTVLEVPSAEVTAAIRDLWQQVKRPVDLVVVMDTSGSMEGQKITAARNSLMEFIRLLDERDNLEVRTFSDEMFTISELSPLGPKRDQLLTRVSGILEGGGTSLYDATFSAYQDLSDNGNPRHIRAVVVLTDGIDTDSEMTFEQLQEAIGATEEGGNAIKVFTIAFGNNADVNILNQISESTGGKQYQGDVTNIIEIYSDIATFF